MIINPKEIIDKKIVNGFLNINNQLQQNGIDLTVKDIKEVVGEGILTLKETKLNERRDISFEDNKYHLESFKTFDILFNEYVKIPKDMCAIIITRSSLNRMGAFVLSGVYDSGFENKTGCILRTHSTRIMLEKNVRIAQIVFFKADSASLYSGKYHVDSKELEDNQELVNNKELNWKHLGDNQWEAMSKNKKHDFVIDSNDGVILNIFDSTINDRDIACVDSLSYDSVDEAKKDAENWV